MYSKEILTLNPQEQFLSQYLWRCKRSRTPSPNNLSLIQIIINLWCSSHLSWPWHQPAFFWQSNPMVWIHLPSSPKVLLPYCDAVSEFVILGRENARKHFRIEPAEVIQPHTRPQVDWLSQDTDTGPVAWASGRRFRQPSSTWQANSIS